jgi:hypothetical protein
VRRSIRRSYGRQAFTSVKDQYDNEVAANAAFQIFEELRNYVQHTDLPISGLSIGHTLKSKSPLSILHTITPNLDGSRLKENEKLGKLLLDMPDKSIDLKPLIRKSMESYARIHAFIRQYMQADLVQSDELIMGLINSFANRFPEDTFLGLVVVEISDTGEITRSINIFKQQIERRQWLTLKNSRRSFYSEIITNEIAHQ